MPRRIPLGALHLQTPTALAIAAVVVANLMWGSSIVAGKEALEGIEPLTLSFLRCLIALAVLVPITRRRGAPMESGRDAALLGLTGVAMFFVCYTIGIRFTSATNATLILDGGEPLAGALLAAILLGERLGKRRVVGMFVALAGIVTVVLSDTDAGHVGMTVLGDGLMVASVLSWGAYLALGRRVFGGNRDPIAVVTAATAYGALFLFPAAVLESAIVGIGMPGAREFLLLAYLGIGCTALTDVLLGYGLRYLEAGRAAVLGNVAPLTGLAAAVVFLGEPVTPVMVGGASLVLAGIAWASTDAESSQVTQSTYPVEVVTDAV